MQGGARRDGQERVPKCLVRELEGATRTNPAGQAPLGYWRTRRVRAKQTIKPFWRTARAGPACSGIAASRDRYFREHATKTNNIMMIARRYLFECLPEGAAPFFMLSRLQLRMCCRSAALKADRRSRGRQLLPPLDWRVPACWVARLPGRRGSNFWP